MSLKVGQRVRILSSKHPHSGRTGALVAEEFIGVLRARKWRVKLDREFRDNGVDECFADEAQLFPANLYECEKCGAAKIQSRLRGLHCPMECR